MLKGYSDITKEIAKFHRKQMTSVERGAILFSVERDPINGFVERLSAMPQYFLRCTIADESDMWSVPRIALLLSDVVLLSGGRIGNIKGQPKPGLLMLCKSERPTPWHLLPTHLRDKFIECAYGYAYFHKNTIHRWLREAEKFIEDGQLMYLPSFAALSITEPLSDGDKQNVRNLIFQLASTAYELSNRNSGTLLSSSQPTNLDWQTLGIGDASMPYLKGIQFDLLHKIMHDERDSLVCFRRAISEVLPTFRERCASVGDPTIVRRTGEELKRDIIDPEVARLNQRFKRIVATRALRIAGGVLGVAGLGLAALSGNALEASISAMLGAGGAGLIAKEYADYVGEILNLKENPWYFAWKIQRD